MAKKVDNEQQKGRKIVSEKSGAVIDTKTSGSPYRPTSGLKSQIENFSYKFGEIDDLPEDESVKKSK